MWQEDGWDVPGNYDFGKDLTIISPSDSFDSLLYSKVACLALTYPVLHYYVILSSFYKFQFMNVCLSISYNPT